MLEPLEGKLSRSVLRGGGCGDVSPFTRLLSDSFYLVVFSSVQGKIPLGRYYVNGSFNERYYRNYIDQSYLAIFYRAGHIYVAIFKESWF